MKRFISAERAINLVAVVFISIMPSYIMALACLNCHYYYFFYLFFIIISTHPVLFEYHISYINILLT